jgi:hypothetical protein
MYVPGQQKAPQMSYLRSFLIKLVVGLEPTAAAWPSLRDANRPFGRLYEWAAKNPPDLSDGF